MNRQDAVKLIAELEDECKEISGRSFMLIRPDLKDELVSGYQVRVKARLDEAKLRCIETLIAQYGYSILNDQNGESLLIYESKEKKGFKGIKDGAEFASM